MTYTTGGLIQATDYNGFVSTTGGANLNNVWNAAYGQSAVSTVAAGATVTATQWATLNNNLAATASHQGTAITSRTSPTAGSIISVLAAMNTDLTNINNNVYNASAVGSQNATFSGTMSKTSTTGSGTSAWSITFTDTITFASAAAANYFFKAGGLVKIQFGKSSSGTSSSDPEWNNFVNSVCGSIFLSSTGASKSIAGTSYTGTTKIGGSGSPSILSTGTGFLQLNGAPTIIYKQFDSGAAYTSNYVQVSASFSGSTLTFTTVWFESGGGGSSGSAISGGTPTSSGSTTINGSAPTTLVTYYPPESTYLSNTWGTPSNSSSVA